MLVRAKVLGFCMGVRRAVEMTEAAIAKMPSTEANNTQTGMLPIYTLGPLIHNPQVLASFRARGVEILEETELPACLKRLTGASVIIRAHGLSPAVEEKLREQGARIIDATCPRVKASQNIAFALAEKGYRIFLAGEKDHAEIKGIYGYVMAGAGKACIIVGNPEEAELAACKEKEAASRNNLSVKTAIIGQTTISEEEYFSIAEAVKKYFPQLEIKNTICRATRDRQDALRELCSVVDAVIVAGGKESANTQRLLSIAKGCGKKAWLVETAADLPAEIPALLKAEFGAQAIGLSAGASTPDSVIDEIIQALL